MWLAVAALSAISPTLVPFLWGQEFTRSVAPLWLLLPGAALLTLYTVLSRYFMALNRQQVTIRTQIASLLVNVALNLVLIPQFGIIGAALASLVSYAVEALLLTRAFSLETGLRYRQILVPDRADLQEYPALLQRLGFLPRQPQG